MTAITLLIVIAVVGALLWLINMYIPMDRKVKTVLNVVVVIILVLWLLSAFGVFNHESNMHLGRLRIRW